MALKSKDNYFQIICITFNYFENKTIIHIGKSSLNNLRTISETILVEKSSLFSVSELSKNKINPLNLAYKYLKSLEQFKSYEDC